jgi:hypothetical protein
MMKVVGLKKGIKADIDMNGVLMSTESLDVKGNEKDMKEHQAIMMEIRQEVASHNQMVAMLNSIQANDIQNVSQMNMMNHQNLNQMNVMNNARVGVVQLNENQITPVMI